MKELYERLIKLAYDDNHGITMQKKEYQQIIKKIKNKKKLNEHDKLQLKVTQRDLKEFKPMWISVEDLKKETEKETEKNFYELKNEFFKKVKRLQKICKHEKAEWYIPKKKLKPISFTNYEVLICENCNKQIKKRKRKK